MSPGELLSCCPGVSAILIGGLLWIAWVNDWVSDRAADRAPQTAPAPGDYRRVFLVLLVTMACNGFVYAGMMNTHLRYLRSD
ncbi:MAG: hypothetical protein CM1200mP18_08020 [Gammaproteobacteria bacterium]|nr:MAG: hypothetical protein CM1200mP18_08020 [Gammaproteobacteria bacterium]